MKTIVSVAFKKGIAIGLALAAVKTPPPDRQTTGIKNRQRSGSKRKSYEAIGHSAQTPRTIAS